MEMLHMPSSMRGLGLKMFPWAPLRIDVFKATGIHEIAQGDSGLEGKETHEGELHHVKSVPEHINPSRFWCYTLPNTWHFT